LRVSARFALGAAVHVLSGSTRETAARTFDDTTYHAIKQNDETRYDGLGVSGSLLIDPLPELRLSLFARSDNRLRARLGAGATAPTEVGFSAGTGRAFARGRALVDVGLEHLRRTGAGLSERVWTFLLGFTVRP